MATASSMTITVLVWPGMPKYPRRAGPTIMSDFR